MTYHIRQTSPPESYPNDIQRYEAALEDLFWEWRECQIDDEEYDTKRIPLERQLEARR